MVGGGLSISSDVRCAWPVAVCGCTKYRKSIYIVITARREFVVALLSCSFYQYVHKLMLDSHYQQTASNIPHSPNRAGVLRTKLDFAESVLD